MERKLSYFVLFTVTLFFWIFASCNTNPFQDIGSAVDSVNPTVSVSSHENGQYITGTFVLSGACTDNISVKKVEIKLLSENKVLIAAVNGNTWSRNITFEDIGGVEGGKTIEVVASDGAGNTAKVGMLLFADVTKPEVENNNRILQFRNSTFDFDSLIDVSSDDPIDLDDLQYFVKGLFKIEGVSKDNFAVGSTTLEMYNDSGTKVYTYTIDGDINNAQAEGNPYSWAFKVDSTESLADGRYLVKILTLDSAGNQAVLTDGKSQGYIYVYNGRPTGAVSIPKEGTNTFPGSPAYATAYDNEGLSKIYWFISKDTLVDFDDAMATSDLSGDIDVSSENPKVYQFEFNVPNADGIYMIYLYPIDKNGLGPVDIYSITPRTFNITTGDAPQVNFDNPDGDVIRDTYSLTGTASHGSGVSKVELFHTSMTNPANKIGEKTTGDLSTWSFNIDSTLFSNGELTFYARAEASAGGTAIATKMIRVDNEDPVVTTTSPVMTNAIDFDPIIQQAADDLALSPAQYSFYDSIEYFANGSITLNGNMTDNYILESIKLEIWNLAGDTMIASRILGGAVTGTAVTAATGNTSSWSFTVNSTLLTDLTKYKLVFAGVDKAGNPASLTKYLYVDQSKDKPQTELHIQTNDILRYNASIRGASYDDDGLNKVYWKVQTATENGGNPSGVYTTWASVDCSNNKIKNWSIELTALALEPGEYKLFARAVDKNGVVQNTYISRVFLISDDEDPTIEITSHANNSALPASFTLSGTFDDNDAVTRVKVIHEGGTTWDSDVTADNVVIAGSTWSKALTVAALGGTYTDKVITVYAYDTQGNSGFKTVTLIGDRTPPVVTITSHSNGQFVRSAGAGFTLSGSVTDKRQDGVTNGAVSSVSVTRSGVTKSATVGGTTWSIASSEFTITEGNNSFDVTAVDNLGNQVTERVFVIVDNTPSTVTFSSPNTNDVLNGTMAVSGTAADNLSGVKALYFSYFTSAPTLTNFDTEAELETASTTNIADVITGAGKTLFKIATPQASWTHNYVTTKLYSELDNQERSNTIYVFMVDNIGNVTTTSNTLSVKIDQREDIPTGQIFSPVGAVVNPQTVVSGLATDDDGVKAIYWYIGAVAVDPPTNLSTWAGLNNVNGPTAGKITYSAPYPKDTSFTLTSPNAIGNFKAWIVVEDANGKFSYYPDAAFDNTYGGDPQNSSLIKSFEQKVSIKPTVTNTTSPTAILNGTENIGISVNGGTTDTGLQLSITSLKYRVQSSVNDSGELTVGAAAGQLNWTGNVSVDTTDYTDTNDYYDVTITVWATNVQGETSQESVVIYKADNKAPSVSISSPTQLIINGTQLVSGVANDWSSVDAIYIGYFTKESPPNLGDLATTLSNPTNYVAGSYSTPGTPVLGKWLQMTDPPLTWVYSYDTTKVYNDLLGHESWNMYVVAVDNVGNISYTTRTYTIDQDMDKPIITITNPGYLGGDNPAGRNNNMPFIPRTYIFMGTIKDGDNDGIKNVHIKIDRMNANGTFKEVVYPAGGDPKTNDDYGYVSTTEPMIIGPQEITWTYMMEDMVVSVGDELTGEFYRIIVRGEDAEGTRGLTQTSYFIVSNQSPEVDIISPNIVDPDGTTANPDMNGRVISNVKDDMYWDNNSNNNSIYYDDDVNREDWGWDSDLNESTFNVFDQQAAGDTARSGYYRMIFRAKDNGRINVIKVSFNGGQTDHGVFTWNSTGEDASHFYGSFITTINNSTIIKNMDVLKHIDSPDRYANYAVTGLDMTQGANSDWVYFFVDVDTTKIDINSNIRITVTDNNSPYAYETATGVQVTVDNNNPTGSIKMFGLDDIEDTAAFGRTSGTTFIGGEYGDVGSAGVRYTNIYVWNNQSSDLDGTPNYNGNTGSISAEVNSVTYSVEIPPNLGSVTGSGALGDILPTNTTLGYPNHWFRGYMYGSSVWRLADVYDQNSVNTDSLGNSGTYRGIAVKYGTDYPSDGKKLICLEVVDNAGNKYRKFYEHQFSEYPATHESIYLSWASMVHATDKVLIDAEPVIYISGDLVMSGTVRDYRAGTNPLPGINRVRVLLKKGTDAPVQVYSSGTGIATTNDNPLNWSMTAQSTTGFTAGPYALQIEVRDRAGNLTTREKSVYIDNAKPALSVTQPINSQIVKGSTFTITGNATDTGAGLAENSVKVEVWDGGTLKNTWNVTPDINGDWSQVWNLDLAIDFTVGLTRTVKVTVTDRAGNTEIATITNVEKGAPPTWTTFTANGSASSLAYASFLSKYSTIPSSEVYMMRGATSTFVTQIDDGVTFNSANLYITGYKQADGLAHSETTRAMTIGGAGNKTVTDNHGYASIPDGEYTYRAKLMQGAAEINMTKYFVVDNTRPNIWAKIIENSDYAEYEVSEEFIKYGYIDAAHGDWGAGYTTGADAVSGVVRVFVKVKDNYLLKNISVSLSNYAFGTVDGASLVLLERAANGTWGTAASRGVVGDIDYFAVTNLATSLNTDSDYVSFILEFNTAKLTNVAGINKLLKFTATDWVGNLTDVTGTNSGTSKATFDSLSYASVMSDSYAKPVQFTLDIVPYITGLTRTIDTERTKYGRFIVKTGETGLTMTGFNLSQNGTNWVRVYNSAGTNYDTVDVSGVASPYTEMTLSLASVNHSGKLRMMVNGVEAVNNINTNPATADEHGNDGLSAEWTDDRYLQLWKTGDSFNGSNQPIYPAMDYNATAGNTLYGSWTNYALSQTYAATTSATTTIFSKYDPPEWTDIAVDTTGNRYVAYLQNFNGGGSGYTNFGDLAVWYSTNSINMAIEHIGDDSGGAPDYSDGMDEMLYQFQNPRITLNGTNPYVSYYDAYSKTLKYGAPLPVEIYTSARSRSAGQYTWSGTIAVTAGRNYTFSVLDATNGGGTGDVIIRLYRNDQTTTLSDWSQESISCTPTVTENVYVYAYSYTTGTFTFKAYRNDGVTAEDGNGTNGNTVVDGVEDTTAPPTTSGDDVGLWSDIGFDTFNSANVPVIVYYDSTNRKLKWARGKTERPVTGSAGWYHGNVTTNNSYIGQYVSMRIDSSNGDLHISAYKNSTGDLVYIKGTITGTGDSTYTFTTPTEVDTLNAVGTWTDMFLVGSTPHISYLNASMMNTFYGLKYAYWDPTLKSGAGDWEYGVVASDSAVYDMRTSIVAKNAGIAAWGGTKGKVAISFGSDTYDIVYLEDEE